MDIRLIAADLDGTLLDSRKNLPHDFSALLDALEARGIRFAPASGRQYDSVLQQFPGMEKRLLFIAENGAVIVDRGELIYFDEIQYDAVCASVELARNMGAPVILSGERAAYLESDEPAFRENAAMYCPRLTRTADVLEAAKNDRICKIAVFQQGCAEAGIYPLLREREAGVTAVLSGSDWVDLMNPGVSKGTAMAFVQARMGISRDQCMAFGDYLNDSELLSSVTHSFAMANAHPALKAASRYTTRLSNEEGGVSDAVRMFLGLL